ncbi:MAG: SOS response-associated peptidase family protein [Balneolaceae bacterium]|nr:SOS response-associated peptidase family protein [Balneolaceae bacterium]
MSKRLAFFAAKEDAEEGLGISTDRENLFKPEYNITPGMHIPVVVKLDGEKTYKRLKWGDTSGGDAFISVEKAREELKNGKCERSAVLASGFFVWKGDREKGFPFFVRLLNSPLVPLAAVVYSEDNDHSHFRIVEGESNVLVQPMSETMPVMLNKEYFEKWLDNEQDSSVLEKAGKQFQLTDMSVMRVSKKVNDPKNNAPELVQPIPK